MQAFSATESTEIDEATVSQSGILAKIWRVRADAEIAQGHRGKRMGPF